MKLKPSLTLHFNGQCAAAFKFYERHLNGKIAFMMPWGESPIASQVSPEWHDKILHARITIGDTELIGSDVLREHYEPPKGFSVLLGIDNPSDGERVFNALAENGRVTMPLQKTFWAPRYGCVVDQFGIPWEINCEEAQ